LEKGFGKMDLKKKLKQISPNMSMASHPSEIYTKSNMQLRSGTVISSNVAPAARTTDANVSVMQQAKQQVRQQVKERQFKIADRYSNKAVDQILGVLEIFINKFENVDNTSCDPVMEKVRMITIMYGYVNSISIYTMMHHRLMKIRMTMLKKCVKFSEDSTTEIMLRIKTAQEMMTDRNPENLHNYYMVHHNAMQTELDQFTKTYKNRL
jgi:hypothetical protein